MHSYSQLFHEFANHTRFIACGREFIPIELLDNRSSDQHNLAAQSESQKQRRANHYALDEQEVDESHILDTPSNSPLPPVPPNLPTLRYEQFEQEIPRNAAIRSYVNDINDDIIKRNALINNKLSRVKLNVFGTERSEISNLQIRNDKIFK